MEGIPQLDKTLGRTGQTYAELRTSYVRIGLAMLLGSAQRRWIYLKKNFFHLWHFTKTYVRNR